MSLTIGLIAGSVIKGLVSKYGDKAIDYAVDFFSEKGKQMIIEKSKEKIGELADDVFDEMVTSPVKQKIVNILKKLKGKSKNEINDLIYEELKENVKLSKEEFSTLNLRLDKIENLLQGVDNKIEKLLKNKFEELFQNKLEEIRKGNIDFAPTEFISLKKTIEKELSKTHFDIAIRTIYEKDEPQEAKKILLEIYIQSKEPIVKVQCILAILTTHRNPNENGEMLSLIDEGLKICGEYKLEQQQISLRVHKLQITYCWLYSKLVEHKLSYEMAIKSGSILAYYDTVIQKDLDNLFISEFDKINKELVSIFELGKNNFYALFMNMPTLIMMLILNATNTKILNHNYQDIVNTIKKLCDVSMKICSIMKDEETKHYFNNILCQAYSIEENKEKMIETAKEMLSSPHLKDAHLKKLATEYLDFAYKEKFTGKFEKKAFVDLNPDEIKVLQDKAIETMLKRYSVDLSKPNKENESIKIALGDMNPSEKMKFCKNLTISQKNTSDVGRLLFIPTMGAKRISCPHAKNQFEGFSLNLIYNSFKEQFCNSCDKREPREDGWEFKSIGHADYYKTE
jgi:hypothetical protein